MNFVAWYRLRAYYLYPLQEEDSLLYCSGNVIGPVVRFRLRFFVDFVGLDAMVSAMS